METTIRLNTFSDIQTDKICYWYEKDRWWIYLPKCGCGDLSNHTVIENWNNTITVTPSILVKAHDNKQRHGYLEGGIWREV